MAVVGFTVAFGWLIFHYIPQSGGYGWIPFAVSLTISAVAGWRVSRTVPKGTPSTQGTSKRQPRGLSSPPLGIRGGAAHDFLHLAAGRKARARKLYTLNTRHFTAQRSGDCVSLSISYKFPIVQVPSYR